MEDRFFGYKTSIILASARLSKILNEVFQILNTKKEYNLSYEEYLLLEIIYNEEGITPSQLSNITAIQYSYICKLLKKLEKFGYIEIKDGIRGKKQKIKKAYLTELAKETCTEIYNILETIYFKVTTKEEQRRRLLISEELNKISNKFSTYFNVKL